MNNVSFLYQLFDKKINKIIRNDFHPYLECYFQNFCAYINIFSKIKNEKILNEYIKLCIFLDYILNTNRLRILSKEKDYIIEKYKLKLKYNRDYIFIFIKILNEIFSSNIVYFYKDNFIIIYLDYEETEDNINLINKIIDNFIPLNFNCIYTFNHIYTLDIDEIAKLERWFLL